MIFDLHNDLPTSEQSATERARVLASTTETVIYAFWTTELSKPLALIANGVCALKKQKNPFAIEDLWFVDEDNIDYVCALNPFYCGLTHNKRNSLAGGALEDGELTALGKFTLHKLNEAGIAVDAAHIGRESFNAVADLAERLIDSHTGLDSVCAHPRNLTDKQVQTILARGGIVGLTAVADFLGGNTANDYVKTIDSFVQKFGIDGVCIGTDFYGTEPLKGLKNYDEFENIAESLFALGYTENDVSKLFYTNAYNYFKYRRQ